VRNDVAMTTLTNYESHRGTRKSNLIPEGANSLQIELADGLTRELTLVRINRSFVFGLLEDSASWCLIRLNQVLGIRFQTQDLCLSPAITWTRKAAGELVSLLSLPAPATICFQNEPKEKVRLVVLGATRGLLATDSHLRAFVPLQAISYLEISPAHSTGRNIQ
jgi:hypothetical protein